MKILAISHLFPNDQEPRYGIFVARQLAAMAAEGASITVLVPRAHSLVAPRAILRDTVHDHRSPLCQVPGLDARSVPVSVLPGAWFKRWVGLSGYLAVRRLAERLHGRARFDVIYATDLFVGGDIARRLRRRLHVPAACLAIGNDVNIDPHQSRGMNKHFRRIIRQLDTTLACGDPLARTMDAITGRQSRSVYGVVNLDEFTPVADRSLLRQSLNLPQDEVVVLFAGYLYRQKGVLELLQAFEQTIQTHSRTRLVLCGHRGEADYIHGQAASSRAATKITFAGEVSPTDMRKYLQAADVFVLPSYTEGMPNAVMEAMACGIPVITTPVGGLAEALADCQGAVLVPPRDVATLAEALASLVGDSQLRSRMGGEARKKAVACFGVQQNARQVLAELRALTCASAAKGLSAKLSNNVSPTRSLG